MIIDKKWKLDRRIPLAVIIMLLLQIASALVWATQLDARVSHMEHQSISIISVNEKFIRLEERLDNMKQDMVYIRRQLERIK
jgi:hypothetical protein